MIWSVKARYASPGESPARLDFNYPAADALDVAEEALDRVEKISRAAGNAPANLRHLQITINPKR